ncbi:unnamed protein product [Heligmosomoides polygyrus]|uniref:Annexin n=1 Tax=Heligmosomoides polygyrus TaxID=6339 RepID=A0A3P8CRR8_HELPZ|nr:unnamed protein product [Heligmosomoides polygyrus]
MQKICLDVAAPKERCAPLIRRSERKAVGPVRNQTPIRLLSRPTSPPPDITTGDQDPAGLPRQLIDSQSSGYDHHDGPAVSAVADSPSNAVEGLSRRHHPPQPTPHEPARQFDALVGRIAPFIYDPDADLTFESFYRRYDDVFSVDATGLDEPTRVRLLLHKLDAGSYERYSSYILPQNPKDVSFKQTVATLKDLFGPSQSLLGGRYACMKLVKDASDDFVTYAGRVNRECAKFKLSECNEDQFKCLIFVCGLQSSDEAFIRLKLLDKIEVDPNCTVQTLEVDPNCTVQTLTEECKRLLNLCHDTRMIEDGKPAVQAIKGQPESTPASLYIPYRRQQSDHDHNRSRRPRRSNSHKTPPSPC